MAFEFRDWYNRFKYEKKLYQGAVAKIGHLERLWELTEELVANSNGGGTTSWGNISGVISSQTDLKTELDSKAKETVSILSGNGLTGGGNLTADRTLSLSSSTLNSLSLADTSLQPGDLDGYVPLTGTEVSEPITGFIEMDGGKGLWANGGASVTLRADGKVSIMNGVMLNSTGNSYGGGTFSGITDFTSPATFSSQLITDTVFTNNAPELTFITDPTGAGVVGADYYGENYNSNSFIQRKYIDDKISYGNTTFILDGATTVFDIIHGMQDYVGNPYTPSSFALTFSDGGNLDFIQSQRTIDDTKIRITCSSIPAAGTMTVYWQLYR